MPERGDDLTSDEPYVPLGFEPEETDMILRGTGNRSGKSTRERAEEGAKWTQPKVHSAETQLPALAPSMQARFDEIKGKLDRGEPLASEDNEYLIHRTAIELLQSKRPSIRMGALRALQHSQLKKLVADGLVKGALEGKQPEDPGAGLGLGTWKSS